MSVRMFGFFPLTIILMGCGDRFDTYSPSQIHRTIQLLEPDLYEITYKWPYVIEHFGPDMGKILEGVDDQEKAALWDQAFAVAVPKYLESKGLIPTECVHGVTIIRNGETEGGGGWAEFHCK